MPGTTAIGFAEGFGFLRWERGRPSVIRWLYDHACEADRSVIDGQSLNMPTGCAWVRYRDGAPRCAVIVTQGTVLTISQQACKASDMRSLSRTMKRIERPGHVVESLNDWEELWSVASPMHPGAGRLLEYFGFHQEPSGLYRRCAAS